MIEWLTVLKSLRDTLSNYGEIRNQKPDYHLNLESGFWSDYYSGHPSGEISLLLGRDLTLRASKITLRGSMIKNSVPTTIYRSIRAHF